MTIVKFHGPARESDKMLDIEQPLLVRFTPQNWRGDMVVVCEADGIGPDFWVVWPDELSPYQREDPWDKSNLDLLIESRAASEFARSWHGPYEIEIERNATEAEIRDSELFAAQREGMVRDIVDDLVEVARNDEGFLRNFIDRTIRHRWTSADRAHEYQRIVMEGVDGCEPFSEVVSSAEIDD